MESRKTHVTALPPNCYECGDAVCNEEGDCRCVVSGNPIDLHKSLKQNKRDEDCPLILIKEREKE